MTIKTDTDDIKKDETETETETVTVVIEKDETKTDDEEKPEVSETAAEHAIEMAERATELAQINAAQAIAEDQEFKTWAKNEIQNLTQVVNEIAILQVTQAEATAAIQENQLLSASMNSPAEEIQTMPELVTETEAETEAETETEAEQNENSDNQEPLEKLREITRRVKARIRVL